MEKFGKFMLIVLGLIISPIVTGFVATKLWLWFIVPTFHMQPLRVIEAIGIMLLIGFVRMKRNKSAESDKFWSNFTTDLVFIIFMSVWALFIGWVVSLFM